MTDFMKYFTEVTTQKSFKKFGYSDMAVLVIHFFERFEEEGIKEDIKNNDSEHFNQCFNDEFINQCFNDEFIYYNDLWLILRFYQLPKDANFNKAMEKFYNDLLCDIYAYFKSVF